MNLLFSLGGFKKEMILIWSKDENEQVWGSEKGTVDTMCDGYRMWGWREEDRCAFIPSSAAYKTTPLVSISCHAYLLYQRIVPQYSVTFPLDNTEGMYVRVCALDVHQCFSIWIDPGFPAS